MSGTKRYTSPYHIISILKLLLGIAVLIMVYVYIDPFQDPQTGIIIGSIGLLFFIWGMSYFIFYAAGLHWSDKKVKLIMSQSYKLSLLVALFFLINIIFLVIEFRSFSNSLITLLLFGMIYRVLFHRPLPEQHTSIDMIIEGEVKKPSNPKAHKDEEGDKEG